MLPVKIRENVYWVGALDWDVRNFHGYLTQRGSSYNAYLIMDEKIVLIDNVKEQFKDEMISRISQLVDPAKIDIVIQNHIEMDHSGSLPKIMKIAKNAQVYCSPNAIKGLEKHFDTEDWQLNAVKTGDSISSGGFNYNFILTPMVHWPDNMVTYIPENKLLFSNDAFGQHIASSERFDNEFPSSIFFEEARKYYANIVLPYSDMVKKVITSLSDVEVDAICPSHGLIIQKHIKQINHEYDFWSSNSPKHKALIIYDSMWGSTKKIATAIVDAFEEAGIKSKLCSLQANHMSDIMTLVMDAKYICVGSPTLNNNLMPSVAGFLAYFNGLAPKNRIGLAFGSYGWGGQSIKYVEQAMVASKMKMLPSISNQYIPSAAKLKAITQGLLKQINEEEKS